MIPKYNMALILLKKFLPQDIINYCIADFLLPSFQKLEKQKKLIVYQISEEILFNKIMKFHICFGLNTHICYYCEKCEEICITTNKRKADAKLCHECYSPLCYW